MRFSPTLLTASAYVLATRIPRDGPSQDEASDFTLGRNGTTFRLPEIKNENYQGPDAQMDLLRAHAKFNVPLDSTLKEAVDNDPELNMKFRILTGGDVTTSVYAWNHSPYDQQYVVALTIGTPGELTYVNLDTGSSDLWVFTSDTPEEQAQGHYIYHPKKSSTSQSLANHLWYIVYGDSSSAYGLVYLDSVQLGNAKFARQAIQSPLHVSSAIASDQFASGILGMGMNAGNTVQPNKQKTFLDNIQSQLAEPLFTANLKKNMPGTYNFGYIDDSEYIGDITYGDIEQEKNSRYWMTTFSGYQVGDDDATSYSWRGVVDTGSSMIYVPRKIVLDYYADVKGWSMTSGSLVVFPCKEALPDFKFKFASHTGTVPSKYMNYGKAFGPMCYGGLQVGDSFGFAIMGAVLMKSQFVVFDYGNKRIGFADKELPE